MLKMQGGTKNERTKAWSPYYNLYDNRGYWTIRVNADKISKKSESNNITRRKTDYLCIRVKTGIMF